MELLRRDDYESKIRNHSFFNADTTPYRKFIYTFLRRTKYRRFYETRVAEIPITYKSLSLRRYRTRTKKSKNRDR